VRRPAKDVPSSNGIVRAWLVSSIGSPVSAGSIDRAALPADVPSTLRGRAPSCHPPRIGDVARPYRGLLITWQLPPSQAAGRENAVGFWRGPCCHEQRGIAFRETSLSSSALRGTSLRINGCSRVAVGFAWGQNERLAVRQVTPAAVTKFCKYGMNVQGRFSSTGRCSR